MATILVTGGTGTLGRQVVPRLTHAGHAVRVLSRRAGGAETVAPGGAGERAAQATAVESTTLVVS